MEDWEQYKAFGEEYAKALTRFNEARNRYVKKFGEHSLDRVLLGEPLIRMPLSVDVECLNKNANDIELAIQNNKPLEQIPEEMWKNMIF